MENYDDEAFRLYSKAYEYFQEHWPHLSPKMQDVLQEFGDEFNDALELMADVVGASALGLN